jgi:hypothetical protein
MPFLPIERPAHRGDCSLNRATRPFLRRDPHGHVHHPLLSIETSCPRASIRLPLRCRSSSAATSAPVEEPEVRPLAGSRLPLRAHVVHEQQARPADTQAVERVPEEKPRQRPRRDRESGPSWEGQSAFVWRGASRGRRRAPSGTPPLAGIQSRDRVDRRDRLVELHREARSTREVGELMTRSPAAARHVKHRRRRTRQVRRRRDQRAPGRDCGVPMRG